MWKNIQSRLPVRHSRRIRVFTQLCTHTLMFTSRGKCIQIIVDKLCLSLCVYIQFFTQPVQNICGLPYYFIMFLFFYECPANFGCLTVHIGIIRALSSQLTYQIIHFYFEKRILCHLPLNGIQRGHYGGMISSKQLSYRG